MNRSSLAGLLFLVFLLAGIGVGAAFVYWTTDSDAVLHRVPLGGGAAETIGTGSSFLLGVTVSGGEV